VALTLGLDLVMSFISCARREARQCNRYGTIAVGEFAAAIDQID
jgi:hypothetical protein